MPNLNQTIDRSLQISRSVASVFERRMRTASQAYASRIREARNAYANATTPTANLNPQHAFQQWFEYGVDFAQRSVLFFDTLRMRGNNWIAHEEAGKPPVLAYKYEVLADGRTLERPVNHSLVRIIPPRGIEVDNRLRPYIIIDPRAGHGPGIGGFKEDSEVGVALSAGHPVYFVIFYPDPEPGQTLADVTDAEAEFVRIVAERHPDSSKPVLVGNCQGGWAVMMLAAARPDIAGALVINGAPMSYWAGNDGDNPLRYAGGLAGGTWLSLLASDLGGGKFDGAHLVRNFENLNPANTLWDKYHQLFDDVDEEAPRFLEFERWWGGFYLMNEEEIRWIVNNLFIGNKLSQGEARLGPGRYFDLKAIKQPIIVFASMGDNITPPQQAFNWISDIYSSTEEIKANGQTIVGLIHEDIGHLGIFVSGKVAKKEHTQIISVLKYIQGLPPGLYGMEIHEIVGADGNVAYDVTLHERKLEDLKRLQKYDRVDEKPFEAVAALSELTERAYELLVRPAVREATPEWLAKLLREWHPLRVQRWAFSDRNLLLAGLPYAADLARAYRRPRSPDNAGRRAELLLSECVSASLDLYRDIRDAISEAAFFEVYGNMMSLQMADQRAVIRKQTRFDARALPAVRQVLDEIDQGGLPEADDPPAKPTSANDGEGPIRISTPIESQPQSDDDTALEPPADPFDKAIAEIQAGLADELPIWSRVFSWAFVHALGKLVDAADYDEQSRSWIDEWLLGRMIARALQEVGLDEAAAARAVVIVKRLTSYQHWYVGEGTTSTHDTLEALLRDSEMQQLLGVNRYQGVLWFNQQSFERLLWWLLLLASVLTSADPARAPAEVAETIVACHQTVGRLRMAAKESGYQVEKLLELTQEPST